MSWRLECRLRNKWKTLKIVKCRLLPPLLVLLSEWDISVSRLLPILGGSWFWLRTKSPFLENLISEKNLGFRKFVLEKSPSLRKFGHVKKVLVSNFWSQKQMKQNGKKKTKSKAKTKGQLFGVYNDIDPWREFDLQTHIECFKIKKKYFRL